MPDQEKLEIVITAKDEAAKVLAALGDTSKKTSKDLEGVGDKSEKAGLSIKGMAAAIGLGNLAYDAFRRAVQFATNTIQDSIRDFQVEEQAVARLRAGLKNTTPEWEKGVESLRDYASQLQRTTTFGDEQIISAQAMLTTFMLNDQQVKQLTPSILDMAAALEKTGGNEADLQQISILLGKAIGGEDVEGLAGALRRVGVVMTEHQTKVLETGKMEERLNTITEIVSQNFGGFAAEAADTYSGRLKQLENQIGDVKERIGRALIPILVALGDVVVSFVSSEGFSSFLDNLTAKLDTVPQRIKEFRDWVFRVRDAIGEWIAKAIEAGETSGVFEILREAIRFVGDTIRVVLLPAWKNFTDSLTPYLPILKEAGILMLKIVGASILTAALGLVGAFSALVGVLSTVLDFLAQMGRTAKDVFNFIEDKLKLFNPKSGGYLGQLADAIKGRQFGGIVGAGQAYVVGERRPELFVPTVQGTIQPSTNTTNVGETSVVINISNISGQQDINSLLQQIQDFFSRRAQLARKGAI